MVHIRAVRILVVFIWSILFSNSIVYGSNLWVGISHGMTDKTYLDLNSVKVVRYDPPFYVIEGDILVEDYESGKNYLFSEKYFYDYNRRSVKYKIPYTYLEREGDWVLASTDIDGKLHEVNIGTQAGNVADALFYWCYKMYFYEQSQQNFIKSGSKEPWAEIRDKMQ